MCNLTDVMMNQTISVWNQTDEETEMVLEELSQGKVEYNKELDEWYQQEMLYREVYEDEEYMIQYFKDLEQFMEEEYQQQLNH